MIRTETIHIHLRLPTFRPISHVYFEPGVYLVTVFYNFICFSGEKMPTIIRFPNGFVEFQKTNTDFHQTI